MPGRKFRRSELTFLGFLPLCFFIAHLRYHLFYGTLGNMLWMCNISNLVLAAGLFFRQPVLIRVSFLWLIPGLPLWVVDMLHTGDFPISTFLSHVGATIVGLHAFYIVRGDRNSWFYAVLYGLATQSVSRWTTNPVLNVNVAFQPYYGWNQIFSSYWQWWLFTAVMSVAGLWLMGSLLYRLFPPAGQVPEP